MKKDPIYKYYIFYLEQILNSRTISKGHIALLKISENKFNDFKESFNNDEFFKVKLIESYIRETRDKKLDDILDGVD